MSTTTFQAFRVKEETDGSYSTAVEQCQLTDLPDHEVLIRVHYAALNYKDALSASGNKGVTRKFPHTPGIDASGVVEESKNPSFKPGDEVIVTSYDLGMNTDGGFAEYIRVPAEWILPKPEKLSLAESMIIGTAGLTAGIGLHKMEKMGQNPAKGDILVTGASGGVGSLGVSIFAKARYSVLAATGKKESHDFLKSIGAREIVNREEIDDDSGRPLLKPKWAGALDTVGGNILATALKGCKKEGSVAACGLVASPKLPTTVFPFILNGINLLGIDSAEYDVEERMKVWNKLAGEWKPDHLEQIARYISLNELKGSIASMLAGKTSGRIIVDLNRS
jgi:acrylyl-CoA reductase (NADPH)